MYASVFCGSFRQTGMRLVGRKRIYGPDRYVARLTSSCENPLKRRIALLPVTWRTRLRLRKPASPITLVSLQVSNGCHNNLARINAINDCIRKTPEPALPCKLAVSRVDFWKFAHAIKGMDIFLPELVSKPRRLLFIIGDCILKFRDRRRQDDEFHYSYRSIVCDDTN